MGDRMSAGLTAPGYRQLSGVTAVSVRFLPGDSAAQAALQAQGLPWVQAHSPTPGKMAGADPFVCWRTPRELLAIGFNAPPLRALLDSLSAGQHDLAMAIDVSEALTVFELSGSALECWLMRLVDATAVPREPGTVSSCRLADAPTLLLRLAADSLWLVVERPSALYVAEWLDYTQSAVRAAQITTAKEPATCT